MAHGNPKRKGGNNKKKNRASQNHGGSSSSPPGTIDVPFRASGDHLNAEKPTPAARSRNIATPPCRYFQRGYCRYGENCYYQHCMPEVPPAEKKQTHSKNESSRYGGPPNSNSIPGGGKKSASSGFEHMISMLSMLSTMGDSSTSDDDEMEQRKRNYGFTDDDVYELSLQGINPWDPEAFDALAVLNGWDMDDDEFYYPFDDQDEEDDDDDSDDDDDDDDDDEEEEEELGQFLMSMNPFARKVGKVKSSVCIKEITDEEDNGKENTVGDKKTGKNTKTDFSRLKSNVARVNEISKDSTGTAKNEDDSIVKKKKTNKDSVIDDTNDKENIVNGTKIVKSGKSNSNQVKVSTAVKVKKTVEESNSDDDSDNAAKIEKMMKIHGLTHDEAYDLTIAGLEPGHPEADEFLQIRRNGSASDMLRYMHGVKPWNVTGKKSVNCVGEKGFSHNGCAFVVKISDEGDDSDEFNEEDEDLKVEKMMKTYGLTMDESYDLIAAGFKPGESEAELLQFLRNGGFTDNEIFELQLRGIKPWEANAVKVITSIRESRI